MEERITGELEEGAEIIRDRAKERFHNQEK